MLAMDGFTVKSSSVDETLRAGKDFAERFESDSVVLLYGEMGAGKTHFVKGMALGLEIVANVTSPTFALVNEYRSNSVLAGRLFHFDLFRIHSEDDLYDMGFYDYIGNGVLAVEWAENIPGLGNEFGKYYKVEIIKISENTREITIDEIIGA
jgi:tRNA threonylcarbamoyladenosine biosynthesis protein TsaE